ncbi:hypothetical protein B0H63DRAFT_400932 [Podospora didyma]|uniref:Myosin heavy chain n=1 Tax=Podospora didyma TaxID=330526 RepID=A0AAE0N8D0_9PEZI|nr:hypothetical protein B0H63DRAFT_400932 [Podospora didyma]
MDRDRQYLRPRMGGAGGTSSATMTSTSTMSDDRYSSSRMVSEWPERDTDRELREHELRERERDRDSQRDQPIKSILRKPARQATRPRRNSDTSITSSNTPAVGSDSELGAPSSHLTLPPMPPMPSSSANTLPRKVFKAKFQGVPAERQGVINLRSSRASSSSIPSGYHVPPVRTVLPPQYPPENRHLDRHDRHDSHERHDSRDRHERHDRRDYHDQDPETASVSESSDLSTTTQATTVASAVSDYEGSDVTPTEIYAKSTPSVRFTPSVIGSSSSVVSASPPSRKIKPRLGTRVRPPSEADRTVAKSGGRTLSMKLLPPSANHHDDARYHRELEQTQKNLERTLLHKIEQLEAETRELRESQAKLARELDLSSTQLSLSTQQKEAAEKERDLERTNKEQTLAVLNDQNAIIDELRSNFDLQKGMLDELEKERDAERASQVELQARLNDTKEVLKDFKGTFELQKVMLSEAEKERDEIKAAKDKSEEKSALRESDFRQQLEERRAHETLLVQRVAAIEIIRDSLEEQRDLKAKEMSELAADRDRLKSESQTFATELGILDDEREAVEIELRKLKDSLEEEKQKILAAAEERQQALRASVEEEQQALKTRIQHLEKELEDLTTAKTLAGEEKAELTTKVEAAEGEMSSLKLKVDELESNSSDLGAKVADLEQEITTLSAEATDLKAKIEGLESDKSSLQKQIEDLESEKTDFQAQIYTLNTDLAGAKAANISLATQKLDLAGVMGGVQETLDASKAEIEQLTSDKAALQAEADKVPGLESTKGELETKVGELEGKVSDLEGKITELQAEADKIPALLGEKEEAETKVAEVEAKVSQLEARAAELEAEAGKLPSLEAAKAELEGKVAELQAKIAELQFEIGRDPDAATAALKAELQAKDEEIKRRVEEITVLTEARSDLSTKLGAARQQLETAQSSLDSTTQSYESATGQIIALQMRLDQLTASSRHASRSRNSSPQKKDKDAASKKDKQLVVVRNPDNRGAISVMLQIAAGI